MNTCLDHATTMRQRRMAIKNWFLSAAFRAAILVVIAVFGVLYLIQMGSVSTRGYVISDLQIKIDGLEEEVNKLEVQIARYRSMKSIQERLQGMEMVAVGSARYITPVGNTVARK